jgi:HAMP domain-containing protein
MKLKTRMILVIGAVLLGVLIAAFVFVANSQKAQSASLYYNQAKSIDSSLSLVRTVVSGHGGVFAKQKDGFGVNPFLAAIPEVKAEMANAKGDKFALINGFSFMQEMADVSQKEGKAAFTYRAPSDKPINPINEPSEKELQVLQSMKSGALTEDYTKTVGQDGKKYYVYNGAMVTKEECMKCHPEYTVGKVDGMMSISLPIDEAEARNTASMLNLGYIFVAALLVVTGVTYVLASRVTAPIKHLAEVADKVSKGEMDVVIDINRKDEIGELAEAFNRLIASIKILSTTNDQ